MAATVHQNTNFRFFLKSTPQNPGDRKLQVQGQELWIFSPLIKLRVPQLLKSHPLCSAEVAKELIRMAYGEECSHAIEDETLLETFKYVCQEKLIDFYDSVVLEMQRRSKDNLNLLNLLSLSEKRWSEATELLLSFLPDLSGPITDEEYAKYPLPGKLQRRIAEIRANPSLCPQSTRLDTSKKKSLEHYTNLLRSDASSYDIYLLLNGNIRVGAHQFILKNRNDYFAKVLQPHTAESQSKEVNLSSIPLSLSSLNILIEYLYGGSPDNLSVVDAVDILLVRDYFHLPPSPFLDTCENVVNKDLSPQNCLVVLAKAHKWDQKDLKKRALEIAVEHFPSLSEQVEELEQMDPALTHVVVIKYLKETRERETKEEQRRVKWETEVSQRLQELERVTKHIRMKESMKGRKWSPLKKGGRIQLAYGDTKAIINNSGTIHFIRKIFGLKVAHTTDRRDTVQGSAPLKEGEAFQVKWRGSNHFSVGVGPLVQEFENVNAQGYNTPGYTYNPYTDGNNPKGHIHIGDPKKKLSVAKSTEGDVIRVIRWSDSVEFWKNKELLDRVRVREDEELWPTLSQNYKGEVYFV